MKPADIAREVAYPLTNATVVTAFITFYLALELITWILSLGPIFFVSALIIAVFVLPALCLYLMFLLEARSKGKAPEPPAVEHLHWYGSGWNLVQVLYYVALSYALNRFITADASAGIVAIVFLVAGTLPASLSILAITRSPLESVHPATIAKLIGRCGWSYWIAPLFVLLSAKIIWVLFISSLPGWLADLVALYLVFAFYALTGAIMQPQRLHEEIDIHEPLGPDEAAITAELQALRTNVLDHAYGFISRGNREGGFRHIHDWIADDPEPGTAWQWYFDNMMRWRDRTPALFFGQQYVSRLLHDGDFGAAAKVILRCRYENEAFQPLAEDREQAVAAAEHAGNEELARALRAGMSGPHAIEVVRRR